MSARVVWEVRQRAQGDPLLTRELGIFTDDAMANQVIQACYRQVWSEVLHPDYVPTVWFPDPLALQTQGWDIWYPNDNNGPNPTFYKVAHRLWNQMPSSLQNFTFSMAGADPF